MNRPPGAGWPTAEQDRRLSTEIARERPRLRLRGFIRRRVADEADAEDILQDVFAEFVATYRLMQPVEHAGAWLFRVAKNRITDLFRRRRTEARGKPPRRQEDEEDAMLDLDELLPTPEAGPEALYLRVLLLDELDAALAELPEEQQEALTAHELEGKSFKQLAEETGESVNTLLSRKHYAVKFLRKRLQVIYDEFTPT